MLLVASPALLVTPAGAQTGAWTPTAPVSSAQVLGTPSGVPLGAPLGGALPTAAPPGGAPASFWSASVSLQETATNNVDLNPSATAKTALVTEITPMLTLNHSGSRINLAGTISLPVVLNLPSGAGTDRVYPAVNLYGDIALVNNFLYVEGAVNVSQQFFSPFGAQPSSLANTTQNRYRADSYRVSPYIRGVTQASTSYELRNDNIWTNLSGTPISTNNSTYTSFSGVASNVQTTLGWQASFNYTDTRINTQDSVSTQIYRGSPIYAVDPNLRLSASGGYEQNRGSATSSQGAIYGVGFAWHPTPRTNLTGDWEKRFFGSSYRFSYDHVTPLSVWNLRLSRNISSYPVQLATLPAGVSVPGFLDSLFLFGIPDPADRQRVVDQFIRDRGLPSTLSSPVNLYTEQILLQQYVGATVGLIGARNTIFVTAYSVRNEPIAASGTPLPPILATGNNNTQNGANVVWTYRLTPSIAFVASADGFQTLSNQGLVANTKQGIVRMALSTTLTPMTTAFAGARYQVLQSDVALDYTEVAIFAGIGYTFR